MTGNGSEPRLTQVISQVYIEKEVTSNLRFTIYCYIDIINSLLKLRKCEDTPDGRGGLIQAY